MTEYLTEEQQRQRVRDVRARLFGPYCTPALSARQAETDAKRRLSESATAAVEHLRFRATIDMSHSLEVRAIMRTVAAKHGLTIGDLAGPSRLRSVVLARQEAMVLVYQLRRDLSLAAIAKPFRRHYTTILHAVQKAEVGGTGELRSAPWTQDQTDVLRRLKAENHSYRRIAEILTRETGRPVTKGAIEQRIIKIGLSVPRAPRHA